MNEVCHEIYRTEFTITSLGHCLSWILRHFLQFTSPRIFNPYIPALNSSPNITEASKSQTQFTWCQLLFFHCIIALTTSYWYHNLICRLSPFHSSIRLPDDLFLWRLKEAPLINRITPFRRSDVLALKFYMSSFPSAIEHHCGKVTMR